MTREPLDRVGALVRLAGPREPVPPDRLHRLRTATHAEWRAHVAARRRRVVAVSAAAAFAAAALVVLGVRMGRDREPAAMSVPLEVATIERVLGVVRVAPADPGVSWRALNAGDRLREGDRLDTLDGGRVVVQLTGGTRVRVDRGTQIRWAAASALELGAGAVYVEAIEGPGAALEVQTPLGVARHIGTQFEVRLRAQALVVRVRDGLVRVSRGGESHDVSTRGELIVDSRGQPTRASVESSGPEWAWTLALARPFTLEGRSLRDFLAWVGEETGWRIRFARASDQERAAHTQLHGSIVGFTPDQAVEAVLPVSGVDHELVDGTLTIQRIASDPTP